MKVERIKAEPVFAPIIITLETEEEAARLWHKLNAPITFSFKQYCQDRGVVKEAAVLDTRMWRALDDVYMPKDSLRSKLQMEEINDRRLNFPKR